MPGIPQRKLYAALIGINKYEKANSLNGCIKDILNFDRILRTICNQQDSLKYEPLYLLAPHPTDAEIIDRYKKSENVNFDSIYPTFENVSGKAFEHLGNVSENDICVFYYSGHGSFIEAPREFWHTKSTHQNETLVCMDSRSTARDLIDKELAFLLYKTLKNKPGVHCLVIMDCCNSGNNTRAINPVANPVIYRQELPSNQQVTIGDYIGYKENFFTIKNGRAEHEIANYVQLSACRDNEKAQDGFSGGLFSRKLAELLSNSGKAYSYRHIVQSLTATISLQNGQQNPVSFSFIDNNLDEQFLGGKFIEYKPSYEVRYIAGEETWQLQAGSMYGIVSSTGVRKTIVNIQPLNIEAEVAETDDFTANLKGDELKKLDRESNEYKATITQLAIKRQVIGISERLGKFPALVKKLSDSFNNGNHIYIELDTEGEQVVDYMTDVFKKEDHYFYYLTQPHNDIPVFKSETDPDSFLNNADAVGKWVYVKNIENAESVFKENDFIFKIDIIEGKSITEDNIDTISGRRSEIRPGDQVDLSYQNNSRPVLKFSVEINPQSNLEDCYIQALYLDSLFGIRTEFSEAETNHLAKSGKFELKTKMDGKYYDIIRFQLDEDYADYNINEVTEHLKIVVSAKPSIRLDAYEQKSLELGADHKNIRSRSTTGELFDSGKKSEWTVFNFNVRIIGPKKDKMLMPGAATDFSSFSLVVPTGFHAIATAVTNGDLATSTRSIGDDLSAAIWGNTLTESATFGDAFGSMTGSNVVALELGTIEGEKMPSLKDGEELVIKIKNTAAPTRSIEGYESTIIPYGYDEKTELYFPIGYEDETGNIHINQLPDATPGSMVADAITTRSVFGSIKLYFKKLLRQPASTFALHIYEDGEWKSITGTGKIKERLLLLKPLKLPLIIHGIFGDTKAILEGLKEDKGFSEHLPAILSYDFENLATTVIETASALKKLLQEINIGQNGIPKITLIAHSMGGLVSRWLVEKEQGDTLVEKLIMAGTPNGGSEWSKAGHNILDGANFLLTHALNVSGPIKYAITGISFFIKKWHNPETTLKDMGLDSQVINDLRDSSPLGNVKYFVIGSNTSLALENGGSDSFFTKVKNALMKNIVFPGLDIALFKKLPNDMAVTLESMKTIPDFDSATKMQILPGDHISYFCKTITRKAILDYAYS